jgi:hypothetical protein
VRSQSEGVKPKMRGRKLRSGVSLKEALNQKGGGIGVKQGLGVVLNVTGSRIVFHNITCVVGLFNRYQFLGAVAKLRKATMSFVMSVRPSSWNNSAPPGRIFMKFDI